MLIICWLVFCALLQLRILAIVKLCMNNHHIVVLTKLDVCVFVCESINFDASLATTCVYHHKIIIIWRINCVFI